MKKKTLILLPLSLALTPCPSLGAAPMAAATYAASSGQVDNETMQMLVTCFVDVLNTIDGKPAAEALAPQLKQLLDTGASVGIKPAEIIARPELQPAISRLGNQNFYGSAALESVLTKGTMDTSDDRTPDYMLDLHRKAIDEFYDSCVASAKSTLATVKDKQSADTAAAMLQASVVSASDLEQAYPPAMHAYLHEKFATKLPLADLQDEIATLQNANPPFYGSTALESLLTGNSGSGYGTTTNTGGNSGNSGATTPGTGLDTTYLDSIYDEVVKASLARLDTVKDKETADAVADELQKAKENNLQQLGACVPDGMKDYFNQKFSNLLPEDERLKVVAKMQAVTPPFYGSDKLKALLGGSTDSSASPAPATDPYIADIDAEYEKLARQVRDALGAVKDKESADRAAEIIKELKKQYRLSAATLAKGMPEKYLSYLEKKFSHLLPEDELENYINVFNRQSPSFFKSGSLSRELYTSITLNIEESGRDKVDSLYQYLSVEGEAIARGAVNKETADDTAARLGKFKEKVAKNKELLRKELQKNLHSDTIPYLEQKFSNPLPIMGLDAVVSKYEGKEPPYFGSKALESALKSAVEYQNYTGKIDARCQELEWRVKNILLNIGSKETADAAADQLEKAKQDIAAAKAELEKDAPADLKACIDARFSDPLLTSGIQGVIDSLKKQNPVCFGSEKLMAVLGIEKPASTKPGTGGTATTRPGTDGTSTGGSNGGTASGTDGGTAGASIITPTNRPGTTVSSGNTTSQSTGTQTLTRSQQQHIDQKMSEYIQAAQMVLMLLQEMERNGASAAPLAPQLEQGFRDMNTISSDLDTWAQENDISEAMGAMLDGQYKDGLQTVDEVDRTITKIAQDETPFYGSPEIRDVIVKKNTVRNTPAKTKRPPRVKKPRKPVDIVEEPETPEEPVDVTEEPETPTDPVDVTEEEPETPAEPVDVTEEEPETPAEPVDVTEEEPETPAEPVDVTEEPETPTDPVDVTEEEPETPTEPVDVTEEEPETPAEPEAVTEEPETPAEPEAVTEEPETPAEPVAVTEEPETPAEPEAVTEEPETPAEPVAVTEEEEPTEDETASDSSELTPEQQAVVDRTASQLVVICEQIAEILSEINDKQSAENAVSRIKELDNAMTEAVDGMMDWARQNGIVEQVEIRFHSLISERGASAALENKLSELEEADFYGSRALERLFSWNGVPGSPITRGQFEHVDSCIQQTVDMLDELGAILAAVEDKASADEAAPAVAKLLRKINDNHADLRAWMDELGYESEEREFVRDWYKEQTSDKTDALIAMAEKIAQEDFYGSAALKSAIGGKDDEADASDSPFTPEQHERIEKHLNQKLLGLKTSYAILSGITDKKTADELTPLLEECLNGLTAMDAEFDEWVRHEGLEDAVRAYLEEKAQEEFLLLFRIVQAYENLQMNDFYGSEALANLLEGNSEDTDTTEAGESQDVVEEEEPTAEEEAPAADEEVIEEDVVIVEETTDEELDALAEKLSPEAKLFADGFLDSYSEKLDEVIILLRGIEDKETAMMAAPRLGELIDETDADADDFVNQAREMVAPSVVMEYVELRLRARLDEIETLMQQLSLLEPPFYGSKLLESVLQSSEE